MNIVIVHVKRSGLSKDYPVFVLDRSHVLGNPYTHLKTKTKAKYIVDTVEEAIECCRDWLRREYKQTPEIREALDSLYIETKKHPMVYYACWCKDELKPSSKDHGCHCDVLRNVMLKRYRREMNDRAE